MKRIILTIGTATLLLLQNGFAQERSHYYTNLLNPFLINPAHAGSVQGINAIFNAKSMLGGIDGSPRTINFGLSGSLQRDAGLGLKVISDWSGVFQTTNMEMAYSKKVQLHEKHFLSFGLSLGVIQTTLKTELLNGTVNLADPTLTDKNINKLRVASGAGFVYKFDDKLQISTSFPSLVTGDDKINGFFISSVSYNKNLGKDNKYQLLPAINFYNMQYSDKLFDAMLTGTWNKTISISTGYRSNGSLLMGAGINFNAFSAQYLYYHHTDKLSGLAPAQNEIAIGFHFNSPKRNAKSKSAMGNQDEFAVELTKIERRVNGLIQIEQTNPGIVNIPNEVTNINKDLEQLLKKFKVETPEHLRLIKNIQESTDLIIAKHEK